MCKALIDTIKGTMHKMNNREILEAYNEFKSTGEKLGGALLVDEIENRYPELYARHYDPETYELDESGLIKELKEAQA